jgi:hypothetical protein
MNKSQVIANLGSSLHKIHSECISDASDSSDMENDISFASTAKSTPTKTNKRAVSRAGSMHSFTCTPRLTPALLRNFEESQSNMGDMFNSSFCGSHRSGTTLRAPSLLSTSFQSPNRTEYNSCRSLFGSPSVASHLTNNKKGNYINDEHFRENIDRLSISGAAAARNAMHQDNNRNPFYNVQADSRALTPSEFSYSAQHRRTVSPVNSVAAPVSWVAGGYWTNQSPQKHKSDFHQMSPRENMLGFYPILSRTSSQSSGFESQVTAQEGPNSRENSVFPDQDRFSVYSEPTFGQMNKPQPYMSQNPKNPAISLFDYHKNEKFNCSNSYNFSSRNSTIGFSSQPTHAFASALPTSQHPIHQSPLYRQFGTQRLYDGGSANPQNFLRKGSIFNLDKINSTLTGS